MTKIIIVVLPLVAAVSACQYPGCVEADRLARQCGGGAECAKLRQAQKQAPADFPGGGHSFGSRAVKFVVAAPPDSGIISDAIQGGVDSSATKTRAGN